MFLGGYSLTGYFFDWVTLFRTKSRYVCKKIIKKDELIAHQCCWYLIGALYALLDIFSSF